MSMNIVSNMYPSKSTMNHQRLSDQAVMLNPIHQERVSQTHVIAIKVRKAAKIKNRYNQVPPLTQEWQKHN